VAVIATGPADLIKAGLTLNYNPAIMTFYSVQDAGLFRMGGVVPEIKQSINSGEITVKISRPDNSNGVRANGQLVLFYFDVTGPGECELSITSAEMTSANGQSLQ